MLSIKSNGYNVEIGMQVFKTIAAFLKNNNYSSYFVICDENTFQYCLPQLITNCIKLRDAHIIEIESGEASKSIEISAHIWQTLIENKADKNSLVINLGGGVVSDLGGFCASTYKRGIDFINIPTTLLSMADASVGGKTGIDFAGLKNSIGTFTQPKAVFINPHFLETLPKRHYDNGLAEIYKIALIADKKFWTELKTSNPENNIKLILSKSVALKNKIVLKDPFDKGIRKILNFGHTIGHAVESLLLGTKEELLHGEAIVIGMLTESHLAFQKKLLSKTELSEITLVFKEVFELEKINTINFNSLLELMRNDKKTLKNKFQFSLLDKIGACKYDIEVTETQLKKAIDFYNTSV
ncbi:MAG: 3-dehydroquinate synthase [Bacteroidota bacterium]|nr:3-dehydroquinate synthase [Bacteroidota bacterium]